MMKFFSKIFLFLFFLPLVYGGVYEYEYHFSKPRIQEQNGHMIIRLPGCMQTGVTGEPQLPAYPLMILLPPGETLESLEVIKEENTRYSLMLPVMPKQPDRPLSMRSPDRTFFKDREVYEKEEYAVKEIKSAVHRFSGADVLIGNIRPLRYYPRSGIVDIAEKIRLRVHTKARTTVFPENKDIGMLEAFIQNPGQLNSYYHESVGRLEQMLIITSNSFASAFDTLRNFYKKYGIESELISTEDIALSDIHGRDLQERMRNTIRERYLEEGLDYVLLGGNSTIVPR
ncbi:MAG: C25 family cysteine peptidase [Candidatus Marinimicrobia bacterium]|nr:C25 family cysteine peptidase [Candidatus Neomarinimicrobiota bacterium]